TMTPDNGAAHSNLGNVLFSQGKLAEAEVCYRRALELRPDMPDALRNLGLVIVDRGRFAESVPLFRRHAELTYGTPASGAQQTPPHKLRHDQEQREYLDGSNGTGASGALKFNLEEGARVNGSAVNPDASHGEIEARWQKSSPQYAVIDNL